MSKILFCGYRPWAKEIYYSIVHGNQYKIKSSLKLIESLDEFKEEIELEKPKAIFFVGWSWIVEKNIVDNHLCICLHPSPLPKYRGGSPIQHQIINGEEESAVTLFKMDEHIDRGDILFQQPFSLNGNLEDIFRRIVNIGQWGIRGLIKQIDSSSVLQGTVQNKQEATYFKRRTPNMSEIKIEELLNCSAKEIYNKIRALQDPYPNAYIVCGDGSKLYLQHAEVDDE